MHPSSGALSFPYIPARFTRGALVAHKHSFAPPCCRTSLYRRPSVPLSVSFCNNLCDAVFSVVGLAGFKTQCFPVGLVCSFFLPSTLLFFSSFHWFVVCLVEVFGFLECSHFLSTMHCKLYFNILQTYFKTGLSSVVQLNIKVG